MPENNERSAEFWRGAKWSILRHGGSLEDALFVDKQIAAAEAREAIKLTKAQWVERYGGQAVLDREGFDVVPCVSCDDTICHGWRVTKKTEATQPTAAEVVAVADKALKRVVGLDYMGDPEVAIQSFPNLKVTPMQAAEELYELRSVIARWKEANGG